MLFLYYANPAVFYFVTAAVVAGYLIGVQEGGLRKFNAQIIGLALLFGISWPFYIGYRVHFIYRARKERKPLIRNL